MTSRPISLDEFIKDWRFWGDWQLSYYDRTHLEKDTFIEIGQISIPYTSDDANSYFFLPFIFRPIKENPLAETLKDRARINEKEEAARMIIRLLKESVVRCGLVRPRLQLIRSETDTSGDALTYLSDTSEYLILVTDTSALRNGVVSFLSATFPARTIWTIIPVFVMMEVQMRAEELKKISYKTQATNYKFLKSRPQVSCVAREIHNIKSTRPVEFLQSPPEFLTRLKEFGKDSLRDSLNDRLIIETTKNLRRERGLGKGLFLVTSDKTMSSLASLNQTARALASTHVEYANIIKCVCNTQS